MRIVMNFQSVEENHLVLVVSTYVYSHGPLLTSGEKSLNSPQIATSRVGARLVCGVLDQQGLNPESVWHTSTHVATCEVPRTHTSLSDQSFTVAGPRLWDNLSLHLRLRDSEVLNSSYWNSTD